MSDQENAITITIIEVPGNRSAIVATQPITVTSACEKASIEIDGRAIRVNSVEVSADFIITDDNSRIALSRGAKGNS